MKRKHLALAAALLTLSLGTCLTTTACSPKDPGETSKPAQTQTDEAKTEKPTESDNEKKETKDTKQTESEKKNENNGSKDEKAEDIIDQVTDGITAKFTSYEMNTNWQDKKDSTISLSDSGIKVEGGGAAADGSVVTITKKGTYEITGSLSDGQIIVDVPDTDKVRLVFNGVNITSTKNAPVYIKSADKAVIILADGTENSVSDPGTYADKECNAAIYSVCNLAFNGSGSLTVKGNYNNGIGSKDYLKFLGGKIDVTALKNAVKGNDGVIVDSAELTVKAGKDGLKADQDKDPAKGFIYIKSGTVSVTADDDGLQAVTAIKVLKDAKVTYTTGGKQVNCDGFVEVP